jgi:hypothetical protein
MSVLWERLTKPLGWSTKKQREATYDTWKQAAAGNVLFRQRFLVSQAIDIITNQLLFTPLNAISNTLNRNGFFSTDNPKQAIASLTDAYRNAAKALRSAGNAAAERLKGRGEAEHVEGLTTDGISAFDRAAGKAEELMKSDKPQDRAKGLALMVVNGVLRFPFRYASAGDQIQAHLIESQKKHQYAVDWLTKNGMDYAEARKMADVIMGDMRADMEAAIQESRLFHEASGEPFEEGEVIFGATKILEAEQYVRMKQAGIPADGIRELVELQKAREGWNVPIDTGLGGLVKKSIELPAKMLLRPLGIIYTPGLFANAIATGITLAAASTPIGFAPWLFGRYTGETDVLGNKLHESPWFRTNEDRARMRVFSTAMTTAGSIMGALLWQGLARYIADWPDDEEEKNKLEKAGLRPGMVVFGRPGEPAWSVSATTGPLALIRPWMAFFQTVIDKHHDTQIRNQKGRAEAARRGLKYEDVEVPAIEYLKAAGVAAKAAMLGGRTASGALAAYTDRGSFDIGKAVAGYAAPTVPLSPFFKELSIEAGKTTDWKHASGWQAMLPLFTSGGERRNFFNDPVSDSNAVTRIARYLTGGTGKLSAMEKPYRILFSTGWNPPSFGETLSYDVGGALRKLRPEEVASYRKTYGEHLKRAMAGMDEKTVTSRHLDAAHKEAKRAARAEVGIRGVDSVGGFREAGI